MTAITSSLNSLESAQASAKIASQDQALNKLSGPKEQSNLKEAALEFEAIFLQLMLDSMRKTVPESEMFKQSSGESIFRGMLDQQYAFVMSEQKMTGIAQAIEEQLSKSMAPQTVSERQGLEAYRSHSASK